MSLGCNICDPLSSMQCLGDQGTIGFRRIVRGERETLAAVVESDYTDQDDGDFNCFYGRFSSAQLALNRPNRPNILSSSGASTHPKPMMHSLLHLLPISIF